MSGPFDRADDPDEVTLWAGRLRSWPARDVADSGADGELDDQTVLSRREAPDDETVRSREAPDDETVVSRHDAPGDDTVRSRVEGAAEVTARSPRDVPDDDTVVSRSSPDVLATLDVDPVDDEIGATAPRRASLPSDVGSPVAPEASDLDEATRRRPAVAPDGDDVDDITRRRSSDPPLLDEATRARPALGVDDDTASGSRRQRREAASAAAAAAEPLITGSIRGARVPEALARESYGPRRDGPARVERTAPARTASSQDAADVRPRARRGATRIVVLVAVIVVVLVAAIVGAAFLLAS